jgi:hypothetical protein
MSMPATTLAPRPPLGVPEVASAAASGERPSELTPLQRSPVALRLDVAGAVACA